MLRDLRCATFVDAPGDFQRSSVAVKGHLRPSRRSAADSGSAFNSRRAGRVCRAMWPDARESLTNSIEWS